ncbi:phosphatidate cytidylyltransferase [Pseudoclavibacter sp. Z016]|uniref:phosphatidate cytidylyltransferase n=1 Tax=Pseudoclavibacter sp. Z016 TaxID=2080581 RepID=UPI0021585037|nr:phosphatidate cytidylyltransferase [Pseudoclavibacter sp. Z016]
MSTTGSDGADPGERLDREVRETEAESEARETPSAFGPAASEGGGAPAAGAPAAADDLPVMGDGAPAPPLAPLRPPSRLGDTGTNILHDLESRAQQARTQVREQRDKLRARNDAINARSGRNLSFAIFFGVVLGALLISSLIFIKQLFIPFAVAMVIFATIELASAMRGAGRDVPRIPLVVAAVAIQPVAYYFDVVGQWLALLIGVFVVTVWRLVEASVSTDRPPRKAVWADFLAAALILIYVSYLGSFTVLLTSQEDGQWWVLGFLIIVVAVDVGAYVFGLNFGKHKLAPKISPGKTWEGFAGAGLTSIVVGILVSIFLLDQDWWFGLIMGPLLLITATAGDLTESMIKRDLKIKDMSSWLPGHGGFFDRIDSILPSGAMAFALYFWSADSTLW